jgi:dTDP-4-dehydrorhamnose reductase
MKVLVLGARGMLGSCLVRTYADTDVLAWDREDLDITNAEDVQALVARANPDVVLNAVAYNDVDGAERSPEVAERVNGLAVRHLAEAALECGATFVHVSTDYVFDGLKVQGYAEHDAPKPRSVYGQSKLRGEQELLRFAKRYPGWRWYCIRTSRLFGPQGSSDVAKQSFVDTMAGLAVSRERVEVIDAEVSSPTYAPDLAHAARVLVDHGAVSGVYHRTNDGACTWHAWAKVVFATMGWKGVCVPVTPDAFPRLAIRPAHSILRTTKLPPMRRWEEAVEEYFAREDRRSIVSRAQREIVEG